MCMKEEDIMAYTVKITYKGIEKDASKIVAPICRLFVPNNCYADTPAYEGTVYDTNVDGFGHVEMVEPYASVSVPFPVPLAQFKLAVVGENNEVTFDVEDYKEAFYYMQVGEQLESQGFEVEVSPKA